MPQPPEALPRHELERRLRRSRTLNLALGALAVIGLVFGGVQWAQSGNPQAAQAGAGQTAGTIGGAAGGAGDTAAADPGGATGAAGPGVERRIDGDPMAIGALDAPVVLSEWIDYRCPFCAVFSRDTFPTLLEEYVETGKVRIEVHDVAFFGEESARAATAARAAGEQGRYFEYLEAVYDAAPESGHPELPPAQLIELARTAGVPDMARFEADMGRQDLRAAVEQSTQQAQQLGVTGVPFFAAHDQALSGAQPIDVFRSFLDDRLAAAE